MPVNTPAAGARRRGGGPTGCNSSRMLQAGSTTRLGLPRRARSRRQQCHCVEATAPEPHDPPRPYPRPHTPSDCSAGARRRTTRDDIVLHLLDLPLPRTRSQQRAEHATLTRSDADRSAEAGCRRGCLDRWSGSWTRRRRASAAARGAGAVAPAARIAPEHAAGARRARAG